MVVLRLFEFEATTIGILAKIHDALQRDDRLILTDAQRNEIVDSKGTRGNNKKKMNNYIIIVSLFDELHTHLNWTLFVS